MEQTMTTPITERCWLLRSKINPFPVGGELAFDGTTLTFTIGELASSAVLGWVADRLETEKEALKTTLEAGQSVEVFRVEQPNLEVTWPKTMGGAAMEATDGVTGHTWLISMDYPSGGAIMQTFNLISGRKKAKAWRAAFGGA
jgi:hypothetical protein